MTSANLDWRLLSTKVVSEFLWVESLVVRFARCAAISRPQQRKDTAETIGEANFRQVHWPGVLGLFNEWVGQEQRIVGQQYPFAERCFIAANLIGITLSFDPYRLLGFASQAANRRAEIEGSGSIRERPKRHRAETAGTHSGSS